MSPVEAVREFVSRRLSAAAGEIFSVFRPTLVQYQEKIQTQQRLLQTSRRETTKLQRTDKPQHRFCVDEQLWKQQKHSSLDQEEPERLQNKEKLLGVDLEPDTIMVIVGGGEGDPRESLDSPSSVRELINQQLTAAAGEIYSEFQQTVIQYQKEIQTQQRLLETTFIPQRKPHGIDGPEQQTDISLEHKEPEDPRIKEEQEEPEDPQIKEEEFYSGNDEDLGLKPEVSYFLVDHTYEGSPSIEPDSELLFLQESVAGGSQQQKKTHPVDSGSTTTAGLKSKNRQHSETVVTSPITPQSSFSANWDTHQGEKPYSCEICGKKFQIEGALFRHIKGVHSLRKPHVCTVCGKSFIFHSGLCRHKRKAHNWDKPHVCNTCGSSFRLKTRFVQHMRLHVGKEQKSCQTCGKTFPCNSKLVRHMRNHMKEKPYSCETCGKGFVHRDGLLRHMKLHTEGTYAFFSQSFNQTTHLLDHVRRPAKKVPFSCDVCGEACRSRSKLMSHMRTHSMKTPYICETCGKTFAFRSCLERHEMIHTGGRPPSCEKCGKSFTQRSHLLRHMCSYSEKKSDLGEISGETHPNPSQLLCHETTGSVEKPYSCETCGKRYMSRSGLVRHRRSHTGEDLHSCHMCKDEY